MRKYTTAGKVAALLLAAVVIAGCPGTTHTVKVGYLYEPEETGISHLTGYGATAAVSLVDLRAWSAWKAAGCSPTGTQ